MHLLAMTPEKTKRRQLRQKTWQYPVLKKTGQMLREVHADLCSTRHSVTFVGPGEKCALKTSFTFLEKEYLLTAATWDWSARTGEQQKPN